MNILKAPSLTLLNLLLWNYLFTGKSLDRIMALKARAGNRDLYDVMNKEKKNRDTETGSTKKSSKNVFDFINKKLGRKKGES